MADQIKQSPPVNISISSSTESCSRRGDPPFTVTITYRCITSIPIWALFKLSAERGNGCEIRDPRRDLRRLGPSHRYLENEGDTEIDFTELVRLNPAEEVVRIYEFIVGDYSESLFHNDIHNLVVGNEYVLAIRRRKWWHTNVERLSEESTDEEKKRLLMEQPAIEWKPNHTVIFQVVE